MIIELEIYKYLKNAGFNVYMETPENMPAEFVTVEKTGGQYLGNGHASATIAVQSWSESKYKAASLSEKVCNTLDDLAAEVGCVVTASGADYDYTDTTTKRYRYQAVFTVEYIKED